MTRCDHCGNVVPDGQVTCPVCGAPMSNQGNNDYMNGGNANQQYNQQNYNNQGYYNQGNHTYHNNVNSMDGEDFSYMYDPMDIANNKTMAVISYLWILWLIPLCSNKTSRYARFHTAQGINLFIARVVVNIVTGIGWRFHGLFLISTVGRLVSLGLFILMIIGIINAANGRAKELPIIGKMHILSLF